MNITKIKKLPYAQRIWKFTIDNRKFFYLTNRKRNYTEIFTVDDGFYIYHRIDKYLSLDPHNKEQGIRRFLFLTMLQ